MKITICRDEKEFNTTAAWRIIGQILEKPDAVIGLSTGQTTIDMYAIVAHIFSVYPFPTQDVTLFNVDELFNVPVSYAHSCLALLREQIVGPLGISPDRFMMPSRNVSDFDQEALRFEKQISERGGADLQILGIGKNGHIGLNQPGTPFESETRYTGLHGEFESRIRREAMVPADVELGGITRGIKNIMQARKVILVAKGAHKAEIIQKAMRGPVTTDIPASVLQLHPNCEILLDAEAGALIAEGLR